MTPAKIALSINPSLLGRADSLVKQKRFGSRSEAFQIVIGEQLARQDEDALRGSVLNLILKKSRHWLI
jgi:metal-responsive CopG/Arc/MetJ family transcriptional regulator